MIFELLAAGDIIGSAREIKMMLAGMDVADGIDLPVVDQAEISETGIVDGAQAGPFFGPGKNGPKRRPVGAPGENDRPVETQAAVANGPAYIAHQLDGAARKRLDRGQARHGLQQIGAKRLKQRMHLMALVQQPAQRRRGENGITGLVELDGEYAHGWG